MEADKLLKSILGDLPLYGKLTEMCGETAAGWRSISNAHVMCSKIMQGMYKLPCLLH